MGVWKLLPKAVGHHQGCEEGSDTKVASSGLEPGLDCFVINLPWAGKLRCLFARLFMPVSRVGERPTGPQGQAGSASESDMLG